MTSEPGATSIDSQEEAEFDCWCCDTRNVAERMVQLGNHPEVRLCVQCAHYVHQQAWEIEDEGRRGPGAFVRGRFRDLRAMVIRRGWHHNRFVGTKLRWLGRYVP